MQTSFKKQFGILSILVFLMPVHSFAVLKTKNIEYRQGNVSLEGYLAYDDSIKGKRPGILVVHEWWGINPYIQRRANQLAELGYIAFAPDIYGKGIRAKDFKEAAALSNIYKSDRQLMRSRAQAGLEVLKNNNLVDEKRMAAIGYCFGGTVGLELTRSGSDLTGTVIFHGSLNTPNPQDAKNIKGKVLALIGAEDPYIPSTEIANFEDEMRNANVDWELVKYSGTVHSFTNPDSGNDKSKGMAYNPEADARSWETMKDFLHEIFK